ncbi:MAG: helix-turn-helix transcriptional regulator [Pseudomonadota bacterium]
MDTEQFIFDANRALFSFDQYADEQEWLADVCSQLTSGMGTDKVYYVGPAERNSDSCRSDIVVVGNTLGTTFEDRIYSDFRGFDESGFSRFSEQYSTMVHRLIRAAGPSAVHDEPFYDERVRKGMRLHQEAFEPAGIVRQMAISIPKPRGEELLIFGYNDRDMPDYGSRQHKILETLLPTFVRVAKLRAATAGRFKTADDIDLLPMPALVVDLEGRHFINQAFHSLIETSDAHHNLRDFGVHLSTRLLASSKREAKRPVAEVYTTTKIEKEGTFEVTARLIESPTHPYMLVQFVRKTLLPPKQFLSRLFNMTSKEINVAELIAQRCADKEIAAALGISLHTARQHASSVLKKTAATRAQLTQKIWSEFLNS